MSGQAQRRPLPRRAVPAAPALAHAVEHARLLRAAGDPRGAAQVLDIAFAAEGVRAPIASEGVRFRALILRADLALALHDDAGAARFLADVRSRTDVSALAELAGALATLDEPDADLFDEAR